MAWTKRTVTARRVVMLIACLVSCILVDLLTHSVSLAIGGGLFVACVLDMIRASWLMSIGLAFLCFAGTLVIIEYAGWINDSPQLTVVAVTIGLINLHGSANNAATICIEMFSLGTLACIVQLARRRFSGNNDV